MEIKRPDKKFPELSEGEVVDCDTEIRWRKRMLLESRRQTLLLEKLVSLLAGNGEKLG